ncbi:MAG TPA: isoaspartyl peptidase/L-asparaginase [Pirellulales bacterium]|nr:isoaspartyl peptidase/L-asparaginase [Pirellulales bacterium]
MRTFVCLTGMLMVFGVNGLDCSGAQGDPPATDVVLAMHGGIAAEPNEVSPEQAKLIRAALEESLRAGRQAMAADGATGVDAVEAAIKVLEDSPLFNAGKGAVFTYEGRNELDASIMEGKEKRAGAVAGVTIVKNPISAARAVMEKSPHVLLIGRGAEVFATKSGMEIVDPGYFWTLPRWKQIERRWRKAQPAPGTEPDGEDEPGSEKSPGAEKQSAVERGAGELDCGERDSRDAARGHDRQWGTVGAVALDRHGNLAAGTSTGGITGKMFGRVGDSPIIGAGTYADNAGCAVSCTGHGEYFIRYAVSHEISSLVKYKGLKVEQAIDQVINRTLQEAGGEGGAITLDAHGRFSSAFNTEGMYRGWITRDGKVETRLWDK